MKKPERTRTLHRIVRLLVVNGVITGIIAVGVLIWIWTQFAQGLPPLQPWHTSEPASEFVASDESAGYTLDDYLDQEARVFDELDELVKTWSPAIDGKYSRFRTDSICNPNTISDRNWNRSLLLQADKPVGGALLVHGLSDSPYSLRAIGNRLHERGWTVLWLRVPGHGTCPGALSIASHKDWSAAMRVAVRGLRDKVPADKPITLFGFSNGGALCVNYVTEAIENPDLPRIDRVALFSPMIGINSLARTTQFYPVVGRVSGLKAAAWQNIDQEIDPFKYSSWPMNASVQAWRMTAQVEDRLRHIAAADRMDEFPPVIAFQSAADSTVVVPKLIERLFDRIHPTTDPSLASELVLFDVNRYSSIAALISPKFAVKIMPLLKREDRPYILTVVTNKAGDSVATVERRFKAGVSHDRDLGLSWPDAIFSLSHNAVPVPMDDPILGSGQSAGGEHLTLGNLSLRGETGVLEVSESLMIRLRHNPFYEYVEQHLLEWLAAGDA